MTDRVSEWVSESVTSSVPQGVPWLVAMGQRLGLGSMGMGLSMATLGRGRATMEKSSTEPTKIVFVKMHFGGKAKGLAQNPPQ